MNDFLFVMVSIVVLMGCGVNMNKDPVRFIIALSILLLFHINLSGVK